MPNAPPTARSVAADVIVRVVRDGAFAAAALDTELERNVQLELRDRALATELVYGALRLYAWLEERLARHASRGLGQLDVRVRAVLVIAAYQLLVLERVPAFAAVNEAVTQAREAKGAKVAGFVNAVLRKIAREPRPSRDELARAALACVEPSLRAALVRSLGEDDARDLVAVTEPPPIGLRIDAAIEEPSARELWIGRLREARPEASIEAGRVSPLAIVVRGAGKIVELPGYAEGAWTPQEEGSQAIALLLGAQPGEVVLDACAGRGNKTGLLAKQVGPSGAVDAVDLHPKKLERLTSELRRIRVAPRATYAVDWSVGSGDVTGKYDRVIVDAPCSGTGTLRRRPEIVLRRSAADLASLSRLQRTILERTRALVRPGGTLVYAVCSVLREEAEEVVASCANANEMVESIRLHPREHGTDGYFAARFVVR
ncbi:MAG TPA: transcription antitermination factor NusB [Labilithrix sp.]